MDQVPVEHVLVIPTSEFHKLGHFQGFCHDVAKYLPELLDRRYTSYRQRAAAEQDPNFKQLIPYVIFRHRNSDGKFLVFQYTRGDGQGERRLHSKRSIGIGGHISSVDSDLGGEPYDIGMRRELDEEVQIDADYSAQMVGLLNDDETDVGRVHLGVVHIFDVASPGVRSRETEIIDAGFRPVEELLDDLESFESWSQICLTALFGPK